jgi:hypothetical protein
MRKPLLALTALAAVAITASGPDRIEASPLLNPSALTGVVDDLTIVDNVHCRPGRPHHNSNRWRRADGCARNTGAVVVVPGRTRYIYRDGVRVRVDGGGSTRTTTTVRTRTNTNVREGSGGMGGGNTSTQRDGGGAGAATQGAGAGTQGGGGVQKGGGAQKGGGNPN